jgi:hypothetical protein
MNEWEDIWLEFWEGRNIVGDKAVDKVKPGSEDQKSCVLPHTQTLDLGQIQQFGPTSVTW